MTPRRLPRPPPLPRQLANLRPLDRLLTAGRIQRRLRLRANGRRRCDPLPIDVEGFDG